MSLLWKVKLRCDKERKEQEERIENNKSFYVVIISYEQANGFTVEQSFFQKTLSSQEAVDNSLKDFFIMFSFVDTNKLKEQIKKIVWYMTGYPNDCRQELSWKVEQ